MSKRKKPKIKCQPKPNPVCDCPVVCPDLYSDLYLSPPDAYPVDEAFAVNQLNWEVAVTLNGAVFTGIFFGTVDELIAANPCRAWNRNLLLYIASLGLYSA
jgi:hypothetical protein